MNKLTFAILISTIFVACNHSNTANYNNSDIFIYDDKSTQNKDIKLSEIAEDFQIVQFENSDTAFFKTNSMFFSDNYICVRNEIGPCKLFNKKGEFIADIGRIGKGPGEYRFTYDILIDESNQCIYLTQLARRLILKYNLKGEFINEIKFEYNLNKPRMFLTSGTVLSLVHVCFKDIDERHFNLANIDTDNPDSIEYISKKNLAVNMIDCKGHGVGFNNEVWAHRNSNNISFMITTFDTLYEYHKEESMIKARFAFKENPIKDENGYMIISELPKHIMVRLIGNGEQYLFVEKDTGKGYRGNIINDFMSNMKMTFSFQDQHVYASYEPLDLKETIEEYIESEECPSDKVEYLQNWAEELDENSNDILFIGKLKD